MKGDPKIIELLNRQLKSELAATQQYMVHAAMQKNWGYQKLANHSAEEANGETKHAGMLMDRIVFLDSAPEVGMKLDVNIGSNVVEQLKADLAAELKAVAAYNEAAHTALTQGDHVSCGIFASIAADEEEHVGWIEAQLQQIEDLGIDLYLSEQS